MITHRRSVSQLNTFTKCGEMYRLERTLTPRTPQRPAAWTAVGSAFHVAYEIYERSGRQFNLDTLFYQHYNEEIEKLQAQQPDQKWWFKTPNVKTVDRDIELRLEHGVKQAVAYQHHCEDSEWEILRLPDGRLALELEFTLAFGDVSVLGYIDKVEHWPTQDVATDIKTGAKGNVSNRQLGLYGLALRELYGVDIHWGQYWYTKLGYGGGYESLNRYTRDYLHDQYTKLDFSINNNLFLANPGSQCGLCSVKPWCREMGATPR